MYCQSSHQHYDCQPRRRWSRTDTNSRCTLAIFILATAATAALWRLSCLHTNNCRCVYFWILNNLRSFFFKTPGGELQRIWMSWQWGRWIASTFSDVISCRINPLYAPTHDGVDHWSATDSATSKRYNFFSKLHSQNQITINQLHSSWSLSIKISEKETKNWEGQIRLTMIKLNFKFKFDIIDRSRSHAPLDGQRHNTRVTEIRCWARSG